MTATTAGLTLVPENRASPVEHPALGPPVSGRSGIRVSHAADVSGNPAAEGAATAWSSVPEPSARALPVPEPAA